uniref:Uncharacterized protein n=1 Tax=Psilocybe cubensis TaxID=181762 RepID=A0A8H7XRS0_PSICU
MVALQVASVLAAPAESLVDSLGAKRSVFELSDDLVSTPGGFFLRSKVHAVPEGALVAHDKDVIHIISSNGTTLHTSTFTPSNGVGCHNISPAARRSAQFKEGYVVTPSWHNTGPSPVASFTTTWKVPPIPETVDGQILYLFNSIEPNTFQSVIQPVLQFGTTPAGGGDYWAIASWFVVGSDVFYTPLTQVSPGRSLTGVITLQQTMKDLDTGNITGFIYNSVFKGVPISSLTISVGDELTWLQESLEIHGPTQPSKLPRGKTVMGSINIMNQDGQIPNVTWSPCNFTGVTDTADGFCCKYNAQWW